MSFGDTANPRVWTGADVFSGPVGTTAPVDVSADWGDGWDPFGLLSEDGLTEARSETSNDFFAWGGVLIRTVRSKHKRTFTASALEDNPTVFALVNPGSSQSSVSELTTRIVRVPDGSNPLAFGFELRDGDVTKRLIVPRGEVSKLADLKVSDADMTMWQIDIDVYPAADGTLYFDITDNPASVVS